jgi:hypothetical protein
MAKVQKIEQSERSPEERKRYHVDRDEGTGDD